MTDSFLAEWRRLATAGRSAGNEPATANKADSDWLRDFKARLPTGSKAQADPAREQDDYLLSGPFNRQELSVLREALAAYRQGISSGAKEAPQPADPFTAIAGAILSHKALPQPEPMKPPMYDLAGLILNTRGKR